MKASDILRKIYRTLLPLLLCGMLLFVGSWIISHVMKSSSGDKKKPTDEDLKKANEAMDTSEASREVERYIDINWIDVVCFDTEEVASVTEIYTSIMQANAILMRSNATFKLRLGNRNKMSSPHCTLTMEDTISIRNLVETFNLKQTDLITVATVVITNKDERVRTKGFSASGSGITFVDKGEIKIPSYTLMHEIGHAWSLPHPFNINGVPYGDLPPACADSNSRVFQLSDCPIKYRSCSGSTFDDDLTNVMDYLPERCGRKYYFSPYQINTMLDHINRIIT